MPTLFDAINKARQIKGLSDAAQSVVSSIQVSRQQEEQRKKEEEEEKKRRAVQQIQDPQGAIQKALKSPGLSPVARTSLEAITKAASQQKPKRAEEESRSFAQDVANEFKKEQKKGRVLMKIIGAGLSFAGNRIFEKGEEEAAKLDREITFPSGETRTVDSVGSQIIRAGTGILSSPLIGAGEAAKELSRGEEVRGAAQAGFSVFSTTPAGVVFNAVLNQKMSKDAVEVVFTKWHKLGEILFGTFEGSTPEGEEPAPISGGVFSDAINKIAPAGSERRDVVEVGWEFIPWAILHRMVSGGQPSESSSSLKLKTDVAESPPSSPPPSPLVSIRKSDIRKATLEAEKLTKQLAKENYTGLDKIMTPENIRGGQELFKQFAESNRDIFLKPKEKTSVVGEQRLVGLKAQGAKPEGKPTEIKKPTEVELRMQELVKNIESQAAKDRKVLNKLAERVLQSKEYPKEIKDAIRKNPESYHQVISSKEILEITKKLSDKELLGLAEAGTQQIGTIALRTLVNRAREKGKMSEVQKFIEEGQRRGTESGRGLQAWQVWLEHLTPEEKIASISKRLEEQNKRLTEPQTKRLTKEFEKLDQSRSSAETLREKVWEAKTEKEFKKAVSEYKKAAKKHDDQSRVIQKEIQATIPRRFQDIFISALQGAYLSLESSLINPVYNLLFAPFELQAKGVAKLSDAIISRAGKKEPAIVMGSPKEYAKGLGKGLKESAEAFVKGAKPRELKKLDSYQGFQPIRALIDSIAAKDIPVNIKTGKPAFIDRVKKATEGTVGAIPEVMFRSLGFGDYPFYEGALRSQLAAQAKRQGLKGLDKKKMIEAPSEFALSLVEQKARKAVFQQENKFANMVNKTIDWVGDIPGVGGAMRFVLRSHIPFVRTPVNAVMNIIEFARPEIAMGRAIYFGAKGNREAALMSAGRGVVGAIYGQVANMIVDSGAYNGDIYENQKKTSFEYENLPPGSISIDGIQRLIDGEDATPQEGDRIVDTRRLGLIGALLQAKFEEKHREKSKEEQFEERGVSPGQEGALGFMQDFLAGAGGTANFIFTETFLGEAADLLDIVSKSNTSQGQKKQNDFFVETWQAVTTIAVPNSIAAFSRATTDEIKDPDALLKFTPLTEDERRELFGNILRERIFMGDDLPYLPGLYGEPLPRVGEDDNPILWDALNPLRFGTIDREPIYQEMYRLVTELEDTSYIPGPPQESFTLDGKKYKLNTPDKYLEYYNTVGETQKELVEQAIRSPFWNKMDISMQGELWNDLHKDGQDIGKAVYAGEEPPVKNTILLYALADKEGNISPKRLGGWLESFGDESKVNKDGSANARTWKEYRRIQFIQTGVSKDKLDDLDKIVKNISTKDLSDQDISRAIGAAQQAGRVNDAEALYLRTQLILP